MTTTKVITYSALNNKIKWRHIKTVNLTEISVELDSSAPCAGVSLLVITCLFSEWSFNPLSPNSDQHLISPHNITDSSTIQVMRMNEMITKDGMS